MSEDRDRIQAYLRWREESTSTRIEHSRFGTALFNDDFSSFIDGDFLRKLGFDPVSRFRQFTKPPEGESYR